MSSQVVWNIVRKNSAFLVKRDGVTFAREEGNVTNENKFKFSGLAQSNTVDVTDEYKLRVTYGSNGKKAGALNKTRPTTVRLQQKGASWASQIANGAVRRKDLERAAKAKYTALAKSTGRKVVGVVRKPKRLRRRRAFA